MSRIFGDLFGVPLKISLFWYYCVAFTVNKLFKGIWELRNISKDKKIIIMKVEIMKAPKMLNPPLIYSNAIQTFSFWRTTQNLFILALLCSSYNQQNEF